MSIITYSFELTKLHILAPNRRLFLHAFNSSVTLITFSLLEFVLLIIYAIILFHRNLHLMFINTYISTSRDLKKCSTNDHFILSYIIPTTHINWTILLADYQ